jgi:hypothetical protein
MVTGREWDVYGSEKRYAQKREIPAMFSTLSKARESLVSDWHVASYPTSDMWDPTSDRLPGVPHAGTWQKKSISILARWSSAYDVYLNIRGENLTHEKRRGTAALSILKELGSIAMMLTPTTVDDQTIWDVFCHMFQNVVSLAEDISLRAHLTQRFHRLRPRIARASDPLESLLDIYTSSPNPMNLVSTNFSFGYFTPSIVLQIR